jgi:RimJ/RimL family protein N-acetyltransferase
MDRRCVDGRRVRTMTAMLRTDRLLLRSWRLADRQVFARLNADPEVMEFFVAPLTREESDAFVDRIEAGLAEHGFGLWAVEEISTGAFIGFAGLLHQTFEAPFTPAFEIGYRLARHAWGKGYATEAAREAVRYAFERAGLGEIVSMTAVGNVRSRAVMHKLGMTHDSQDDFDHPRIPDGHPLKRHVLYRLTTARGHAVHMAGNG